MLAAGAVGGEACAVHAVGLGPWAGSREQQRREEELRSAPRRAARRSLDKGKVHILIGCLPVGTGSGARRAGVGQDRLG